MNIYPNIMPDHEKEYMSKLRLRPTQEKWPHTQWQADTRCPDCGRQFVADYAFKTVTEETWELIKKALLERNSLRGICRIFDVSLMWLLAFVAGLYAVLPADLGINLQNVGGSDAVSLYTLAVEADEIWSFVAKKNNKQWISQLKQLAGRSCCYI